MSPKLYKIINMNVKIVSAKFQQLMHSKSKQSKRRDLQTGPKQTVLGYKHFRTSHTYVPIYSEMYCVLDNLGCIDHII